MRLTIRIISNIYSFYFFYSIYRGFLWLILLKSISGLAGRHQILKRILLKRNKIEYWIKYTSHRTVSALSLCISKLSRKKELSFQITSLHQMVWSFRVENQLLCTSYVDNARAREISGRRGKKISAVKFRGRSETDLPCRVSTGKPRAWNPDDVTE